MRRATAVLVASLWSVAPASAEARPRRPLLPTLATARRECARPGPRLAELVERGFDPRAFGKEVIPGWDELSEDQRSAFATLADAVVGSEQRQGYIQALCVPHQKITWVGKLGSGADAVTRVETTFTVLGDPTHAELWFRDDGDRWTYVGTWCCGVDVFILTWRDRLKGGYEAAMTKLREGER
jgi:hypothetical protein